MKMIAIIVPATTFDLISAATWFFTGATEDAVLSRLSGRIGTSDGTRAARSGGWSFPTGGLAYKRLKSFPFKLVVSYQKHALKQLDVIIPPDQHRLVAFLLNSETYQDHGH